MDLYSIVLNLSGLAVASFGLARAKLAGSAVLIHFIGAHRQGFGDRDLDEVLAAVIGIATMNPTAEAYAAAHRLHHANDTFATLADPDARLLYDLGLRPGRSYRALLGCFYTAPLRWALHGPMTWARLVHTFGPAQPRWRRATAFVLWGGLAAAALAGGWFGALLLGAVLPLLMGGNVAAFIELASRHRFLITGPTGRDRQRDLSHGRHLLAWWPGAGAPWWRWALLPLSLLAAVVARLVILPGDLGLHDRHHTAAPVTRRLARWSWTNATYAYGHLPEKDVARVSGHVTSIRAAVHGWLHDLSLEAPLADDGAGTDSDR